MGKFLLLAFRNVFRNRRRTIMTLLMVGGGVAGLLLVGGFFARMFWGLRESTINDGLGHIQIFTAEHFNREEKHVLDTGIENWRQVAGTVSTGGHVRAVAPRIEFNGMLSNGVKSGVFMGSAVDPVAEESLGFTPRLAAGRDLDTKPADDGGSWLSVNRLTGLVGEAIAVSVNPAGLVAGSYHGTVSVTAEGGVSQQVNVPVTLSVQIGRASCRHRV